MLSMGKQGPEWKEKTIGQNFQQFHFVPLKICKYTIANKQRNVSNLSLKIQKK